MNQPCACGCSRRDFLATVSLTAAGVALHGLALPSFAQPLEPRKRTGATVRVLFLYPPSAQFAKDPDGWWSWPGNDYDAEGRQRQFAGQLRKMEKSLSLKLDLDDKPVATNDDVARLAKEIEAQRPDGLLLVMFYNRSLPHADALIKAAQQAGIPTVFYVGLGVKHGPVTQYRVPGLYFIQSLDNFAAIESGLRMINTRKLLSQSRLLRVNEAKAASDEMEKFLGITLRTVPFARYADLFQKVAVGNEARRLIARLKRGATELRQVTAEALDNAMRAHFALKQLLAEEQADGLTMNCLRRGMLKPCISFSLLNGDLVPAACENDRDAVCGQLLGQLLTGQPGFQHNPAFDTERNHYYASHCTCATKLRGPNGGELPYLLRRFAHTNEGSCAIQVFWKEGDPVTMIHYYSRTEPSLDVYAGRVVKSHAMPPAGGCTTNVEIELTDRRDACEVKGHHNLLFCGDHARRFREFANLHKLPLATAHLGVELTGKIR